MCKEIKNNKNYKKNKLGTSSLVIYILLFILFSGSIFSELLTGESIFANLTDIKCPVFLQAPAIFEIIKIVGFSNVIVAFIYMNTDKKMLGLSYLEILDSRFSNHGKFSILHLASTLICIAVSSSGLSESSIISLCIVCWGFFYQFYVLFHIVLSAKKCEELAVSIWKQYCQDPYMMQDSIRRLVSSFPSKESKHYRAHINCLASILVKNYFSSNNQCNVKYFFQVLDLIFKDLNSFSLAGDLFYDFSQEIFSYDYENNDKADKQSDFICMLISSYFALLVNKMLLDLDSKDKKTHCYISIVHHVSLISCSLNVLEETQFKNKLLDCVNTNAYLMALVLFLCEEIDLTKSLFEIHPENADYKFFNEICSTIFTNEKSIAIESKIDFATSLLNESQER